MQISCIFGTEKKTNFLLKTAYLYSVVKVKNKKAELYPKGG